MLRILTSCIDVGCKESKEAHVHNRRCLIISSHLREDWKSMCVEYNSAIPYSALLHSPAFCACAIIAAIPPLRTLGCVITEQSITGILILRLFEYYDLASKEYLDTDKRGIHMFSAIQRKFTQLYTTVNPAYNHSNWIDSGQIH